LALNKLDEIIAKKDFPGKIYILGSIIHNPQVVSEYAAKGVISVDSPDEIPAGSIVVIRAHGIAKQIQLELSQRGVYVVDATCPKVKDACVLIEENTADGRTLLLFGEKSHPEVKCLLSYAGGNTIVFDSLDECKRYDLDPSQQYCLAAQTTQDLHIFDSIAAELSGRKGIDLVVLNTICNATQMRQKEATQIAEKTDFVIVVGGYNSSNTSRLAQVVEASGTSALHVETAQELPVKELSKLRSLGLTAGASTPKKIVDDIQSVLESL